MKSETIKVKSKDFGEFSYILEQPETLQESVDKFGMEQSLDWLHAGRKAEVNAAEWQKVRGTKTEEVEVEGKTFRVPKELAALLAKAKAGQAA